MCLYIVLFSTQQIETELLKEKKETEHLKSQIVLKEKEKVKLYI